MSVWAELSGSIEYPPNAHFSWKKHLEEYSSTVYMCEFTRVSINRVSEDKIYFSFDICADGIGAAKIIEDLIEGLPNGSHCNIYSVIRWLK